MDSGKYFAVSEKLEIAASPKDTAIIWTSNKLRNGEYQNIAFVDYSGFAEAEWLVQGCVKFLSDASFWLAQSELGQEMR